MPKFTIHTIDTAPQDAKPILEDVQKNKFGFIPNLLGLLAEAPTVLKAYLDLDVVTSKGSLSAVEKQIIMLTVSRLNGCEYCVAAHSVISDMQKLPADVIEAVREDKPIADSKLEALRQFVKIVVSKQGWADENSVSAFLSAGYTKAQVLEVVLSVAQKTLSNYANHILNTPLDQVFEARRISLKAECSTSGCKAS